MHTIHMKWQAIRPARTQTSSPRIAARECTVVYDYRKDTGEIELAVSFQHPNDNFIKKEGRRVALERFTARETFIMPIGIFERYLNGYQITERIFTIMNDYWNKIPTLPYDDIQELTFYTRKPSKLGLRQEDY